MTGPSICWFKVLIVVDKIEPIVVIFSNSRMYYNVN